MTDELPPHVPGYRPIRAINDAPNIHKAFYMRPQGLGDVFGKYTLHRAWYQPGQSFHLMEERLHGPLFVAVYGEKGRVVAFSRTGLTWVNRYHRKRGLGSELHARVLAHIGPEKYYVGQPEPRFTPGGTKVVKRAYELLLERGLVEKPETSDGQ